MKTKQYGIIAISVILTLGIVAAFGMNTESFLTSIYNTTDKSANVSFTSGTYSGAVTVGGGATINETTALTNTVNYPVLITHDTSGTPANGIGVGIQFQQETTAGDEIGGYIEFVATDVTGASEDFEYNVGLMANGAAASQVLSIGSTGIQTLPGGATLDNTTSATDLNITEDSVTITGDFETTGTATLGGNLILESADEITNAVAGTVILDAAAVETTGTLETVGTATLGGNLILESADEITNAAAGTVILDAAAVETTGTLETTGTATLGGNLILESADEITNAVAGTVILDAAAVETTGTLETVGTATLGGNLILESADEITNAAAGTIILDAVAVETTGTLETAGTATLGGAVALKQGTIADGDATPDVSGGFWFTTSANTAPTEITDLDNPVVGAMYCLIGGSATNSSTITDGGSFNLSAGWTAALDDVLCLYVQADNDYIEISRSDN